MFRNYRNRIAALAVVSIVCVGACSKKADDPITGSPSDSVLRFVPADTPYLFTSGKPVPDKVLDKLEPKADEMLKSYRVFFQEIMMTALADKKGRHDEDEIKKFMAVGDEVMNLFSVEGMRAAGIERNPQFALFGNGLLPVVRIEVSDTDAFEETLSRIDDEAGEAMSTAKLDGNSYRYVGDDEGRVIIGVFDGFAVFTLAPVSLDDTQLRTLVGLDLPDSSIAKTDIVKDIIAENNFNGYYVGFLDTIRITDTFLDSPTGLNAQLLKDADFDATSISKVCKEEIRDVAGIAPRMVFGYEKFDADEMVGSFVVEMREDIATGLSKLTAPVPGLGFDSGGLMSFGMSFDLQALRAFYEERLDALEADPFECEYFADIQAGVEKGKQALNQPVPPFVYGVRGFNAVVNDLGDFDWKSKQPPDSVDASFLIAMEDAQSMIAMGAMFSPQLANLNLQPDGKPVEIDLPQMQAFSDSVFAAMQSDALAISLGSDAEDRVTKVLNADTREPAPALSMAMDAGQYYSLIAEAMSTEPDDEEKLSREAREAMRDAMLATAELYDRMAMNVQYTNRGIEVKSRVTLAD